MTTVCQFMLSTVLEGLIVISLLFRGPEALQTADSVVPVKSHDDADRPADHSGRQAAPASAYLAFGKIAISYGLHHQVGK